MLDQRRRRWADVVQMLYKYFVFVGWQTKHLDTLGCQAVMLVIMTYGVVDMLAVRWYVVFDRRVD